jgi:dodecin
MSTYKIVEVVGTSELSWDDAARNALETARKKLHDLRVGEVTKMDLKVAEGKLLYRTRLNLSFKYLGSS